VIQPGKGLSTRPSHQSRVKLRTRGFLRSSEGTDDKCVDRNKAVEFTVGDGDVIQGRAECSSNSIVLTVRSSGNSSSRVSVKDPGSRVFAGNSRVVRDCHEFSQF